MHRIKRSRLIHDNNIHLSDHPQSHNANPGLVADTVRMAPYIPFIILTLRTHHFARLQTTKRFCVRSPLSGHGFRKPLPTKRRGLTNRSPSIGRAMFTASTFNGGLLATSRFTTLHKKRRLLQKAYERMLLKHTATLESFVIALATRTIQKWK